MQYSVKPIRIEYFGHVVQMDQSESRIFTFYSDNASKTEWAPEDEFSGGYGRLRAVTGGSGVNGLTH